MSIRVNHKYYFKICTVFTNSHLFLIPPAGGGKGRELGKPFPYEQELRDKTARLIFLDAELNPDANKGGQQEQVVAKSARPSIMDKLWSQPAPSRTDKKQKRHEEVR